jgi:hypothetical protein
MFCAGLLLVAGSAWGETYTGQYGYPGTPGATATYGDSRGGLFIEGGGTWKAPDRSGLSVFNRMEVTTPDVAYGGSGSVTIPFELNQRARVTVVIYDMNSTETGKTGPHGAWIRVAPQPQYVNHSPVMNLESGSNSWTWDGTAWDGSAAGAGDYEYDVIAFNDFEANLVGTGHSGAWGQHSVDTNVDPPETWSPYQETPPNVCYFGTVDRDYVANPTAYEQWTITAFDPQEENNASGNRPDDLDPNIHWSSRSSANENLGTTKGILKLKRNDAAKTLDLDTSYGDEGQGAARESIWWVIPHRDNVYSGTRSGDPLLVGIEVYDKTSGEMTRFNDMLDWFHRIAIDEDGNQSIAHLGISIFAVNDNGIWMTDHATDHFVHTDHEGNVKWCNTTGDGIKDWLSAETAQELGIASHAAGSNAVTVSMDAHPTGKMSIAIDQHNQIGYNFGAFGRDGTGLANVEFSPETGPFNRGNNSKHIDLVNDGGKYDGLYISGGNADSQPFPSQYPEMGMGVFVPYDLASGTLGGDATAVEDLGPAGTPDSYSLSDAYPNPFNPETSIEFSVPATGYVEMVVYNAAGQQVASLVDREMSAGTYKTMWDALDHNGMQVSSGVYFYRMEAGDFAATHSMTLLK